jgi:ATP-dependent Clp protease protease subunit
VGDSKQGKPMTLEQVIPVLLEHAPSILESLAIKLDNEATLAQIDADFEEAHADAHRIYSYFDAMEWEPVRKAVDTLGLWARRDQEKDQRDITILLNSPGGYCVEGFALFDWIEALKREQGVDVQIVGLGQVSSMACVVMQAASHRVMHRNAWMLCHEVLADMPPGYYDRKLSIIEEELAYAKRIEMQGTKILARRSKLTVKEILKRCYKTDWWLSAAEALEVGFIDEVR